MLTSLLLVVPIVVMAACGDDREASNLPRSGTATEAAIRVAVSDYYDALVAEEPDRACSMLTANAQRQAVRLAVLETALASPGADSWCVAAMNRYYLESDGSMYAEVGRQAALGTITVDGRTASVQPADRPPLRVIKRGDRWMLDSLGLEPGIAMVTIYTYCHAVAPPARSGVQEKQRAVAYLIGVLRRAPDAARSAVRPFVVNAIRTLRERDCDGRSARRLDRALKDAGG